MNIVCDLHAFVNITVKQWQYCLFFTVLAAIHCPHALCAKE